MTASPEGFPPAGTVYAKLRNFCGADDLDISPENDNLRAAPVTLVSASRHRAAHVYLYL